MNADRELPVDSAVGSPILLDVTLRDGGYVNGHSWTADEAVSIVRAMEAARVPYAEVGYLRTATGEALNPSERCEPDYLEVLAAEVRRTRLVVMVRPGEVAPQDLKGVSSTGVGMARVLASRLDVDTAAPYIEAARAEGLTAAVNLTHASRFSPAELGAAVRRAAGAGAQIVYLADSNGSLYPRDTTSRIRAAVEAAGAGPDGPVIGFHPHDNLGLAFANTFAALDADAGAVDASLGGIGKGGGNLRLELIAAHLTVHAGADFSVDPLLRNRSTITAQLRMLSDAGGRSLVSGLLDVSLDQSLLFQRQAARHGYDVLLRGGIDFRTPAPASRERDGIAAGE
ncbi:hypothetical protein [Streptantibioticus silvisoli]|uniref:Pyruvate carboxyltransferase domain-containing protein n=1 Tax=Streptantibioticus silvisoli TaxID=2705255 RepID=A0ABT6W1A3_9ACTN|nr:hypothetical protein [Streptantibioticus silvisoli]MDI5964529.1 hypothetical protein [Streptantibioticus silvisoli]